MTVETQEAAQSAALGAPRRTLGDYYTTGAREIRTGWRNWRVWYLMGSGDMRRRFERSKLGPAWIAISTSVMVLCIGALWSRLWAASLAEVLPFIAIGMVSWQFLLSVVNDGTSAFPSNSGYFANQYMAPSNVIFALLYKNLMTYLINLIVPALVCVWFAVGANWATLLFIPGLVLQIYVLFCAAYVVAIFCTRFRDVAQVVQNLMQFGFFLTPILWKPDILPPDWQRLVLLNPLASLLAIVREPMMGKVPPLEAWAVVGACGIVLTIILLPLVGRVHRRIVYWL